MWNALEPFLYEAAREHQRELLAWAEAPPRAETAAPVRHSAPAQNSGRPATCPWIARRVAASS